MKIQHYYLFGISPTMLQDCLEKLLNQFELNFTDYKIDQTSEFGELRLIFQYQEEQISLYEELFNLLENNLAPYIFSKSQNLPECLIESLKSKSKLLAVAESCTGGLISSQITKIPGASAVFDTGVVTYSNASKMNFLNLDESLLVKYGAVSSQTAEAMVQGLLKATQADFGIAVTGIAGPSGGTIEKPNGTVYIAWGDQINIRSRQFLIALPRIEFQKKVTYTALNQLRRFILKNKNSADYYFDRFVKNRDQ